MTDTEQPAPGDDRPDLNATPETATSTDDAVASTDESTTTPSADAPTEHAIDTPPTEPTEPAEPDDEAEATEPVAPAGSAEPTIATDAAEPTDAAGSAEPTDATAPTDAGSTESARSVEDTTPTEPTFADLGLRDELLQTLSKLGYEEPSPIQAESIPVLLAGHDVLGQAATGTGKTAAFALPLLDRIPLGQSDEPGVLVLCPTRELAVQVSEAMHRYGRNLGARVVPIYGGQPIGRQLGALRRGVDIVVATPGRALDHIARGTLKLGGVQAVVLDEADEMLDMGFAEDIESILDEIPQPRQTVLFSATLPRRILSIAERHQNNPRRIEIAKAATSDSGAPLIRQTAYLVRRDYKPAALGRILDIEAPEAALVFCRTRTEVDDLTETLNGRGYRAEALHGGLSQEQRDRVMGRLKNGSADLLIATDVAARGLDVDTLTHVVNYDVPNAPDAYVHRIGRVGRAGREGTAITLAEPRQHRQLKNIERAVGRKIPIEKIPTVADLQARRLELTRTAVRESIVSGDHDEYSAVVDALSDEFDLYEIALGAIALAHESESPEADMVEIPDAKAPSKSKRDNQGKGKFDKGDRGKGKGQRSGPSPDMTRVFVGLGRRDRLRPGDLVGAIANETSLQGRDIGAIEITDKFALVEVPDRKSEEVIRALRSTTIRGRKATIRRDRF